MNTDENQRHSIDEKTTSVENLRSSIVDVARYSPYLVFHPNEVCFPITHREYLAECKSDPNVDLNGKQMYDEYKNGKQIQLSFANDKWADKLQGVKGTAPCYVRIIEKNNIIQLVYYYLFSHTSAYNCCRCGFAMTSYAHKADLKFILVEVKRETETINRVYFGAHGTKAGQWRNYKELDEINVAEWVSLEKAKEKLTHEGIIKVVEDLETYLNA